MNYKDNSGLTTDWDCLTCDITQENNEDEWCPEDLAIFNTEKNVDCAELFADRPRITSFAIDCTGYYNYILLNGDKESLNHFVGYLNKLSLVAKFGRSYRPAFNSITYDWYIRLPDAHGKLNKEQVEEHVRNYISLYISNVWEALLSTEEPGTYSISKIFEKKISDLKSKIIQKENRIAHLLKTLSKLSQEKPVSRIDYQALQKKLLEAEKIISEKDDEVELLLLGQKHYIDKFNKLSAENKNITKKEVIELKTTIEKHEENIKIFKKDKEKEHTEYMQALDDFELTLTENIELKNKIFELESTLIDLKDTAHDEFQNNNIEPGLYKTMLRILLPNIEFINGSFDFIATELQCQEDMLVKLYAISTKPQEIKAKRVQSATDWKEIYFKAGTDIKGRLYFRIMDSITQVFVSSKSTQKLDFKRLAKI
jgi:hypothetical protein